MLFVGRQFEKILRPGEAFRRFFAQQPRRAGNAFQVAVVAQPAEDFADRPFAHAVDQDVGFGIDQHGGPQLVLPVIVMGRAAHAGFKSAKHHRHAGKGAPGQLGVDRQRMRRPLAGLAVFAVGVVMTFAPPGGVDIDHRIEIAGSDADGDRGRAHNGHRRRIVPIRLGDDAGAEAHAQQNPPDQGDAERGMIDIGVAGDQEHVQRIPAAALHLGARHRQERHGIIGKRHEKSFIADAGAAALPREFCRSR
ncbi:hypothetical protein SDC9_140877 [bioreactor metagenome]|uniref:Uncharacterized protein n=1 Tax=bioreactor metagenome TaxID=1076179 RepID=A0A645DWR3_9ZZZZ